MTNDNYETDEWLMEIFRDFYDPCPLNSEPVEDSLKIKWEGDRIFINPPYSKPLFWVKRAIKEMNEGKLVVLLLRVDTSTEWFKLLVENNAHFLWINKRLKHRTGKPANFPSMLVVLKKQLGVEE